MRDINVELETSDDNDDIIDLEDIIEMPDSAIDEDEDLDLDVDVEILDADTDLTHEPPKAAVPAETGRPQAAASDHEDLLESLGDEPEEETVIFEAAEPAVPEKQPAGKSESQLFDLDDDSFLQEFLDKPDKAAKPEEKSDFGLEADAGFEIIEETGFSDVQPEAAFLEKAPAPQQPQAAAPASAPAAPVSAPAASAFTPADELLQTAEELVERLESRLQEHIRLVVESRLPDLVRSIIKEEIDKLKKELP